MAVITADNADMWRSLLGDVSKEKPSVGRTVRITRGRLHQGKIGKVMAHMRDKYTDPFRYGNEASHMMTEARGRSGYVIKVGTGTEVFWCKADYAMVCLDD